MYTKKFLCIQLLLFLTSFEKIYPEDFCENFCDCCCEGCLKDNKEEKVIKIQKNWRGYKIRKEYYYLKSVYEDFHNNIRGIKHDPFDTEEEENKKCKYRLEKKYTKDGKGGLGKGSYGEVYKVVEKTSKEIFAVKKVVIKKNDKDSQKLIENEIKNMIALRDNDNIIKIIDVYRWKNFVGSVTRKDENGDEEEEIYTEEDNAQAYYIVMEYCDGMTLLGWLKNMRNSDVYNNNRDRIAFEIISAVYACFKKGISHMDLKPENIMLDKINLKVKLIDFGLSKKIEEKCTSISGSILFLCYEACSCLLAYEQEDIKYIKEYNTAYADIYSMGIVLYELYVKQYVYNKKNIYLEEFFEYRKNLFNKIEDNIFKEFLEGVTQKKQANRWFWERIFNSKFYEEIKTFSNNKKNI